jgi:hypothetical protein
LGAREASLFPWKSIWKMKALPHIAFFTWTVALSKLLTIDNLQKQGLTLVNWCCLCKKSEETINHIFICCEFTSEIWYLVLTLFGVSWVMPCNILELLHCWKTQGRKQSKEAIWKSHPYFTNVKHLERKKSTSFQRPQV